MAFVAGLDTNQWQQYNSFINNKKSHFIPNGSKQPTEKEMCETAHWIVDEQCLLHSNANYRSTIGDCLEFINSKYGHLSFVSTIKALDTFKNRWQIFLPKLSLFLELEI